LLSKMDKVELRGCLKTLSRVRDLG
jgi:hypothetical protein